MTTTTRRSILAQATFALCVAVLAISSVNAAVINHGMVMGPDVAYLNVSETADEVPLYGAPITIGNNLAFFEPSSPNPSIGFSAQAAGGSGEITDGFLNFTMMAKPGRAIDRLEITEGGDYTMARLGQALAQVSATLQLFQLNILEVDGIPLNQPVTISGVDATTTVDLPPGPNQDTWDLGLSINVKQALTDNGIDFDLGATKLTARIDNTLTALSQPGSVAGIFKKDFDINPDISIDPNIVPEPTTLVLAGLGLVGMLAKRRTA